jgi:hypothetical protein
MCLGLSCLLALLETTPPSYFPAKDAVTMAESQILQLAESGREDETGLCSQRTELLP